MLKEISICYSTKSLIGEGMIIPLLHVMTRMSILTITINNIERPEKDGSPVQNG
jgi:hypothetical protein